MTNAAPAPRIEAFLAPEGRWWTMPYSFADEAQAEAFLTNLRAHNPEREFRLGTAP